MGKNNLDKIVENLLYILPIFHKKLLKINLSDLCQDIHMSQLHMGILLTIRHEMLPISDVAKKLLMSKPQMTLLINQLSQAGIVEKKPNQKDRRIIDITLTQKGQEAMKQCDDFLKNNIKRQLSNLSPGDQQELAFSIQNIRNISDKWQNLEKSNLIDSKRSVSGNNYVT
jgi:DNA-binding MarR family transcriptional regulator